MPQKTPPPLPLENLVDRSGLTPSAPHQEKTERVAADHQKRRGGKPKIDLTNRRFGRLVAITEIAPRITKGGNQQVQWRCLCDCGKEKITSGMKKKLIRSFTKYMRMISNTLLRKANDLYYFSLTF